MKFGKKQMQQLSGFSSSAVMFGISAAMALVYFTNWRVIADLIPYYNGQFVVDTGRPRDVVEDDCDAPGCKPPPPPPEDPCMEWERRAAEAEEAKAALAAAKAEAAAARKKPC